MVHINIHTIFPRSVAFLFLGILPMLQPIVSAQDTCATVFKSGVPLSVAAPYGNPTDLGLYRRTTITSPIRLAIHIVQYADGTGGLSDPDLTEAVANLNDEFAQAEMQFFIYHTDIIQNDTYATLSGDEPDELRHINRVPYCINVYFVPQWSGFCGEGSPTAELYNGAQGIIIKNSCATGSTVPHEMGHYFNLFHTHESARYGKEHITRNENDQCYNADLAGDLLPDTPADPGLLAPDAEYNLEPNSCMFMNHIVKADGCGRIDYDPDTHNLMSYARHSCRTQFTQGQKDRMNYTLTTSRAYLLQDLVTLRNRVDEINAGGTLSIDGNTFDSGIRVPVVSNTSHTIGTNNQRFRDFQNTGVTYQHHDWNQDESDYKLSRIVLIEGNNTQNANFKQLQDITLEANYPNGIIKLQNPWLAQNTSDYTTIQNGTHPVFLNQNADFQPDIPIYRLRAPATTQADETDWYFQKWDGTDVTFQHSHRRTSSVVFRHAGATAKAVYKGHLRSDTHLATAYSNGRKVTVNTGVDGNGQAFTQYNTVYTDHGAIYLAAVRQYADGSITEYPETRVSEGTGNNGAPAIATLESGDYGIFDVVVWTRVVDNQSEIVYTYLYTDWSSDFQPVPIGGMLGESSAPTLVATVSSSEVRPAVIGWIEGTGKNKDVGHTPQTKGIIITWKNDAHHLRVWTKFDQGDEPLYTIAESGTGLGHPAIGIPDRNGNEPFFITYAVDGHIHLRRLVAPANLTGDSPNRDRILTSDLGYLTENVDPQLAFGQVASNQNQRTVFVTWTGIKKYDMRFSAQNGLRKEPGGPGIEPVLQPVRTTWLRAVVERPLSGITHYIGKTHNLLYWPDDPNGSYPHAAARPQIAGLDAQKTVLWRDTESGKLLTQTLTGYATTDDNGDFTEDFTFNPVASTGRSGDYSAMPIQLPGTQTTAFWTEPQFTPGRVGYTAIGPAPAPRGLHRVMTAGTDSTGLGVPYAFLDFQHSQVPPHFRHGNLHAELWPAQVQQDTTVRNLYWNATPDTAVPLVAQTDAVSTQRLAALRLTMQFYGEGFSRHLPNNPHTIYRIVMRDHATHQLLETLWHLSWRTLRAHLTQTSDGVLQLDYPVDTIVPIPATEADSVYLTCETASHPRSLSPQTGVMVYSGNQQQLVGDNKAFTETASAANGSALQVGAYPNPFNPTTTISYTLPVTARVSLTIYDLTGRVVRTLVNTRQAPGAYAMQWDGTNHYNQQVASGMYFYRLKAGNTVKIHKILLVR